MFDFDSTTLNTALEYGLRTLAVIAILMAGYFVGKTLSKMLRSRLKPKRLDRTLVRFGANALRWGVMIIAVLICFGVFGIEVTSLAALLGAAGVTIGLAFQGSLSNIASGVLLMIVRPFGVGDIVEIADEFGKVTEIDLMVTKIVTMDNKCIVIPNRQVLDDTLENFTAFPTKRVDVAVGVAYDTDLRLAKEALMRAARSVHDDEDHDPDVVLDEFGDSSINLKVRVWGPSHDYVKITDALVLAIKDELDAENIEIPFPQVDLNVQETRAWRRLSDHGRQAPATEESTSSPKHSTHVGEHGRTRGGGGSSAVHR